MMKMMCAVDGASMKLCEYCQHLDASTNALRSRFRLSTGCAYQNAPVDRLWPNRALKSQYRGRTGHAKLVP
jgi:hypothetical protein